jgi:integrase
MLHVDNAWKGFFEREQYEAVLRHLPDFLRPVAAVAYITGWRTKSELLTRHRRHVDFANGWLRLEPGETKKGAARNFPFTPEQRSILETQRELVRQIEMAQGVIIPWVFIHPPETARCETGSRIKNFQGAWAKACKAAGLPGRLVHDFRRTAVRNRERAGVSRSAAMKLTGHKTEAVYRRYAIVDSTMLQEAVDKLGALHAAEANNPSSIRVSPVSTRN